MFFSFKQVFGVKNKAKRNQVKWRRLLRKLMMNRKGKNKRRDSVNAGDNIVRFRLSQHPPVCFDCQILMGSYIALYQHCRTQHRESLVNAQCCEGEYYTAAAFAAHCESAHMGQHVCIRCRTFFESPSALKDHLREHDPKNRSYAHFCIVCGMFKNSKEDMQNHLRFEHNIDRGNESQYVCHVPQSAMEVTTILAKAHDHESFSESHTGAFTPTLENCVSFTLHAAIRDV